MTNTAVAQIASSTNAEAAAKAPCPIPRMNSIVAMFTAAPYLPRRGDIPVLAQARNHGAELSLPVKTPA